MCWMPAIADEEMALKQREDADFQVIHQWFDSSEIRPMNDDVRGKSTTVRSLWSQWSSLVREDGILYRRTENTSTRNGRMQLLVPRDMRKTVFSDLHESPTAGHLGLKKTVSKVRERFYWPGLQRDIQVWCQNCVKCGARKNSPKVRHAPLGTVPVGCPMERIGIDILGPLPETEKGNKYILVVEDYFTKWNEAYPMPDQEARTVAMLLLDEFVCRYGAPDYIHSDQGRQFESALFKELCQLLDIKKTRTSPYHPQSDGLVERFNSTVAQMLSHYVDDYHRDWDVHLPRVMMAYRSSVHESTKFTPHFLMFGREIRLPIDVMYGRCPEQPPLTAEAANDARDSMESAYGFVRDRLQKSHRRQKNLYDRRVHGHVFKVNDPVWVHMPAVPRGRSRKFYRPWQGPYVVEKCISDTIFRIKIVGGKKTMVVHFDRLKPYYGSVEKERPDPTTLSPLPDTHSKPKKERRRYVGEGLEIISLPGDEIGGAPLHMQEDRGDPIRIERPAPSRYPRRQRQPPDRYGFVMPSHGT